MIPRTEILEEKKLIGMNETMSLTNNKTFKLFSTFMPRKKEIFNAINQDVFDLRIYTHEYYSKFNPNTEFIKWALVEVSDFNTIPDGMQTFTL